MKTILFNAKIYTQDFSRPFAEAMLIEEGVIQAVGTNNDILSAITTDSTINTLDLEKQTVLPGFTDAHIHLLHLAINQQKVDCETQTRKECLERIEKRANERKPGEWILGHGWNHHIWPEGIGNVKLLDQISPENPVYLTNKSLHGAWVNSLALQKAGISTASSNPEGGIIQRDILGNPDGILLESAVNLIESILPALSLTEAAESIHNIQKYLFKHGITTIHDFDRRLTFSALQKLDRNKLLKVGVVKSIPVESLDAAIALGLQTGFGNSKLRIGSIKLFMDGALGTQTAAMLEPYENSNDKGLLLLCETDLFDIAVKASENKLSLAIHSIGDHASRVVVEVIDRLRNYEQKHSIPGLHHRIEHLQNITPSDLSRMADLRIIASMQPLQLSSDIPAANQNWGSRNKNTYTFRSVIDHEIPLVFGSDAPVEKPDCFAGLHAAVNRTNQSHLPKGGWYPEQKITVQEAVRAFTTIIYTIPGAVENKGFLLPGYQTDLIVLNHNIYEIPQETISDTRVTATMIRGDWVWQR